MNKPYLFADDCPMCGQKDEAEMWKGARIFNTEWKHHYLCCSDKCGRAFLISPKHKELERLRIKGRIADLEKALKEL